MKTTRTRYTVYDNETDFPIIVCGTSAECAARIGCTRNAFNQLVKAQRDGRYENPRYYIVIERGCDW